MQWTNRIIILEIKFYLKVLSFLLALSLSACFHDDSDPVNRFTVGVTVNGLAGSGLALQNNGTDDLAISANGSFTFVTDIADGSTYTITVLTQPDTPNQTCTVTNGSGIVSGSNITNVSVSCVTTAYTVGGTVSGLAAGNSVVLQNNGGDDLTVSVDGGFNFATAIIDGEAYNVSILTQPTTTNQTCAVSSGSGNVGGANVTNVTVNCVAVKTYSLNIKDSEGLVLSDPATDMGHSLKILDTATRLVMLDYENSRILFYTKGLTLADSSIISIIGTHSNVSDDSPYNSVSNNKLNSQFSGTIHNDELWVTNYRFGEILRFDLDGNFIDSQTGKYTHLDSDKVTLYAFEGKSIYSYSELNNAFEYNADLPISVDVGNDEYIYRRGAIHLGYGRLAVNDYINSENTMRVFDLAALLNGQTTEVLTVTGITSFAILSDKIVWSTVYHSDLEYCDLDGANCGVGTFSHYLYSFRHNPGSDHMYVVGAWGLQVLNTQLSEVESITRSQYYWSGNFFGGDDTNLYFFDHHDGGLVIAPRNSQDNTAFIDPANEIAYSGWHLNPRMHNGFLYLQSEWPVDSYEMYIFDITNKSSSNFPVTSKQGFDVDTEFLYVLNGLTIDAYTHQGIFDHQIILSNLANSNLQDFTNITQGLFAKNDNNFFIAYNSKLNKFSLTGEFIENHDLNFSSIGGKTMLFADNERILLNSPLSIYDLTTNQVSGFPDSTSGSNGFVNGNIYWYTSGYNQYSGQQF